MKNIVLIHFLPLEYYPPVTNMINYLAGELGNNIKLSVFSTHNKKDRNIFNNHKVRILRTAQSEGDRNKLIRFVKYLYFQVFVLFRLTIMRPRNVLYYESLSSFPVYLYKRFINRKAKIYIHYHEYTTPEQYQKHSMAIERYFHKLEQKFIYKKATWISHTNKDRLKMFFNDNPNINKNILEEMPNYPPKSWSNLISNNTKKQNDSQLKCVYIGSLSIKNTYVKEFVDWVRKQNGKVIFDIYAYNTDKNSIAFLSKLNDNYINFYNDGVEYSKIPSLLKKYDVGIIFYKPYSHNVINCVSNKFYEYYACGLDVWFSNIMQSTMEYVTFKEKPFIIPVNFLDLNSLDISIYTNPKTIKKGKTNFFCNDIYSTLKNKLQ